MMSKTWSLICIALALALCLCGCSEISDSIVSDNLGMEIGRDDIRTDENIHIRDKNLLYENQDNTENYYY